MILLNTTFAVSNAADVVPVPAAIAWVAGVAALVAARWWLRDATTAALERAAQVTVKEGIAAAEAAADYVTRDLFLMILEDTEEHIEWLETQLDLIVKVGIQNYLQSQISE